MVHYTVTLGFEQLPLQSPDRAGPLHQLPRQTPGPAHSPPQSGLDHTTPLLSSECPELLLALGRGGRACQTIAETVA